MAVLTYSPTVGAPLSFSKRWLTGLVALLVCGGSAVSAPPEASTADPRAAADITRFYQDEKTIPPYQQAIANLSGNDPAKREAAGHYLRALCARLFADETEGRAPSRRLPYWGGGSENAARELRAKIAESLGKDASGDDALDAAAWLLDEDPGADNERAGFQIVQRTRTPRADALLVHLLARPHPAVEVLLGTIPEAARRGLPVEADLRRLSTWYRPNVREAARKAAAELGIGSLPDFHPAEAFTPWLNEQLHRFAAMVPEDIPGDAQWVRVSFSDPSPGSRPTEFSGWLTETADHRQTIVDYFCHQSVFDDHDPKSPVMEIAGSSDPHKLARLEITPRAFADDARDFAQIRNTKEEHGSDQASKVLSSRGGLTGQFQPRFISLPEALVAAWAYQRNEKEVAAAILFPRLDAAADDRWLEWAVRDVLGHVCHQPMLEFFSRRDYGSALRLARHLSQPIFDGYEYQPRARELAAQLARRQDDFKTFVLPLPTDWDRLKADLDRTAQIRYLAERLRLLNCIQMSQPGGVDYADDQSQGPMDLSAASPPASKVVNPYNELRGMDLTPEELPALIPFLADDDFMPTFSYWRDFHPARTLHRVNWAVAEVVNDAVRRDLVDVSAFGSLDESSRKEAIAKLLDWCQQNHGKTPDTLTTDALVSARDWQEFERAIGRAVQHRVVAAAPIIAGRIKDFGTGNQEEIAQGCFALNAPEFLSIARAWANDGHQPEGMRFWSALGLVQGGGDADRRAGVGVLQPILAKDTKLERYALALDTLLASGDETARQLACGALRKPDVLVAGDNGAMAVKLFLAGRPEALAALLRWLDDASARPDGDFRRGDGTVADGVAQWAGKWRLDKYTYSLEAPAEERRREQESLKDWFKAQFGLVKAGKKTDLFIPPPYGPGRWRIDAP